MPTTSVCVCVCVSDLVNTSPFLSLGTATALSNAGNGSEQLLMNQIAVCRVLLVVHCVSEGRRVRRCHMRYYG